jgi:transposase InsO family protein
MNRLHELCQPCVPSTARRGLARQRVVRERETSLRGHVVELAHWTHELGLSLPHTAGLLHLCARTLRAWCGLFLGHVPRLHLLGRPTLRSPYADRRDVLAVLDELGPATSVATLRACFPTMPRAELAELLGRYRRVWRMRHQHAPHVLEWTKPGTVWAMDFAETPQPIDGIYPYLLAVRDLASGYQLLWQPVPAPSADETILALRSLFAEHGAPLVLKTDNGSAFCADATRNFLAPWDIQVLFSPPHTPQYNGAIEAGIGSLKTRTERHAATQGHAGYWTADDVAAAQAEANATARPKGPTGPTPDQLWRERRPITTEQRALFEQAVARQLQEVYAAEGIAQEEVVTPKEERKMTRAAIRRALVECDYLLFTRRRIPLPITRQKSANIT